MARAATGRGKAKKKAAAPSRPMRAASAMSHRAARWAFGGFVLLVAAGAAIALDIPAKAGLAAGEAVGDAGFRVRSVDVQGLNRMNPKPVYAIAIDQKTTALPLVDVGAIRDRLLGYGWVEDARVSRRYPDTLVVDIVERKPAAIWQAGSRLTLIDKGGVVLDQVPVTQMPDLPLITGEEANRHARDLEALLAKAPAIRNQLVAADWIGLRRWNLRVESGETIMLPEGQDTAMKVLTKFVAEDKKSALLGIGMTRYDLRLPDQVVACCKSPSAKPAPGSES